MILEVRYKGQKVNLDDIEIDYTDYCGEKITSSSIEEYGNYNWDTAWDAHEAGENW